MTPSLRHRKPGMLPLSTEAMRLRTAARPLSAAFHVHKGSVDQVIATATFTKVQFPTEEFDWGGDFDNGVNARFTCPRPGLYHFSWNIAWSGFADQVLGQANLYKNGVSYKATSIQGSGTGPLSMPGHALVEALGGDYFEIFVYQSSGSNKTVSGGPALTWFDGRLVG